MKTRFARTHLLLLALCAGLLGCERNAASAIKEQIEFTRDAIRQEIDQYRLRARGFYNNSKFDELEALADEARASKALFANGAWKVFSVYDSLGCRDDEPENMWELHDRIHQAWVAAKPESVTARIAQAQFLVEFAWHARGDGFAETVTPEGGRLFAKRLAQARGTLEQAKALKPKCPMWWFVQMTVARGQGWSRADFDQLFKEAKAFEPQFWRYNVSQAGFLLPRWYGQPGDWERAAEAEAQRAEGLGWEGYARVVSFQRGYYDNVFKQSKASWPRTLEGFEVMRQKYPDSLEILSGYCRLACLAGDRALAKKLFEQLGNKADPGVWRDRAALLSDREWALGGK